jgi:hypothetical protein
MKPRVEGERRKQGRDREEDKGGRNETIDTVERAEKREF